MSAARLRHVLAGAFACTLLLLAAPSVSRTAEPPNQNDPCSREGRNVCGTTGVGFYQVYRYGIRWFGDFRGALPGFAHTYCLDLGFWYPSRAQQYREDTSPFRNREGEAVTFDRQRKIAYAVWTYGRTSSPNQAAAVMLYVHSLMGDARPGETDPTELNRAVTALYANIARDAERYHGPYRMEIRLAERIHVGEEATATIRVLSAAGNPLPNLELTLSADGASGVPGKVQTNADGVAVVTLTATSADGVRLTARTAPLAATLPRIFTGSTPAARRNGQRLTTPDAQTIVATRTSSGGKVQIRVSTVATPTVVAVGETSRDRVTITGALPGYRGTVTVRIHGPFRSVGGIRCDQTPAWEGSFSVSGPGVYTTPPARLARPGWYVYQEVVPDDAAHVGTTTTCTEPNERVRVEVQPRVRTIVSSNRVVPGASLFDRVLVQGLAGEEATVQAALYGPFASREAITCEGTPIWSGSITVRDDGEYRTEPFTVTVPGYYTYQETIEAAGFVRAAETACGDAAETTVVPAQPQIVTQVSAQQTRPGARITDRVVVTGLGALSALVRVELWGPFATRGGIRCSGTPYWTGLFVARGDGTYVTAPVLLEKAGYYTYRESIAEGPVTSASATTCGDVAETTVALAVPTVTTVVSSEITRAGSRIFDRILVRGLGETVAAIDVELFGPFASRSAMRCTGRPYWTGRVFAKGDGVLASRTVKVSKAGFYTYRERLVGSPLVTEFVTECPLAAETSLVAPKITTGRAEAGSYVPVTGVGALTPRRVRLAEVGLDAPVSPVGIDTANNELGVPPQISRTGWWRDGAAPGSGSGVILIAGHVDSARGGPGAFVALHRARVGSRVQVTTTNGRTFTYRVVSVRNYPKPALPTDIYSLRGAPRLVLVTCGGLFNRRLGSYRDNIVLTAVPV